MGRSQQDGKKTSSGTKVKLPKDDLAFLVETTNYTELEIKWVINLQFSNHGMVVNSYIT